MRRKILRKIRVLRTARGVKSWIRVLFHRAPGNWWQTTTKNQQHILKSGDMMTLYLQAPGNWCEVMTVKSKGQSWNSTMCKSRRRSTNTRLEGQCTELVIIMSTMMKASIHLGPNYNENLEVYKSTNFEEPKNLFDITQRLLLEHEAEILNVSPTDWTARSWTRSTLTHDQGITWTKAKVRVC